MQCCFYNERCVLGGIEENQIQHFQRIYRQKHKHKKGHNFGKNQKFKKKQKKGFWRVTSRVLCPNFKFLAQTVWAVAQKLQFLQYKIKKTEEYLTLLLTKDLFGSKIGGFQ